MVTDNCKDLSFNGPTLVYPNGGEIITANNIIITWFEPSDINEHSKIIWHEILFTESYSKFGDTRWKQIASVPSNTSSFYWQIPISIKSNSCRIGIRSVNNEGFRSKISHSSANFVIKPEILPKPAIIEPISGKDYFSYVPIILDPNIISGKFSSRAFYNVSYRSDSLGVDWTTIKSGIPISQRQLYWDVKNLPTSYDYVIKVEVFDNNVISEPSYVRNVRVNSLNYFIIDTVPPVGEVDVLDTSDYINYRNVSVRIQAADKTTAVEKYRLEQEDVVSPPIMYTDSRFRDISVSEVVPWNVQGDDGIKLIKGRFVDYGGNTLPLLDTRTFFRNYKTSNNEEATAFVADENDNLWSAFGTDGSVLFFKKTMVASTDYTVSDMKFYNSVLYLGGTDESNYGYLLKYTNRQISTVLSFDTSDSVITSMSVFDNKLFMGLENGRIYAFNGATSILINGDNILEDNIVFMATNNGVLFVFVGNSLNYWTIIKSNGDYILQEHTLGS